MLDLDGSGKIDKAEFIRWALIDALGKAAKRILDMLVIWDTNGSGDVRVEGRRLYFFGSVLRRGDCIWVEFKGKRIVNGIVFAVNKDQISVRPEGSSVKHLQISIEDMRGNKVSVGLN